MGYKQTTDKLTIIFGKNLLQWGKKYQLITGTELVGYISFQWLSACGLPPCLSVCLLPVYLTSSLAGWLSSYLVGDPWHVCLCACPTVHSLLSSFICTCMSVCMLFWLTVYLSVWCLAGWRHMYVPSCLVLSVCLSVCRSVGGSVGRLVGQSVSRSEHLPGLLNNSASPTMPQLNSHGCLVHSLVEIPS